MKHPNFYENLKEALLRLRGTVVLYDGLPYQVITITNHKPDGIYRVYLDPTGRDPNLFHARPDPNNYPSESTVIGTYMDQWMAENPSSEILRKQMNSPLFNKFRPYPLGMCNYGTGVHYVERQPNRKTEQGLIRTMLDSTPITSSGNGINLGKGSPIEVYSRAFRACILADHPSAQECLTALLDPAIDNNAAAFHRHFALVRGPIDMLFLAYKTDVVGVLSNGDFSRLRLGRDFMHTREVIDNLGIFTSITL